MLFDLNRAVIEAGTPLASQRPLDNVSANAGTKSIEATYRLRQSRKFAPHHLKRRNGAVFLSCLETRQSHAGQFEIDFWFTMPRRDDEERINLRSLSRPQSERRHDPVN